MYPARSCNSPASPCEALRQEAGASAKSVNQNSEQHEVDDRDMPAKENKMDPEMNCAAGKCGGN